MKQLLLSILITLGIYSQPHSIISDTTTTSERMSVAEKEFKDSIYNELMKVLCDPVETQLLLPVEFSYGHIVIDLNDVYEAFGGFDTIQIIKTPTYLKCLVDGKDFGGYSIIHE